MPKHCCCSCCFRARLITVTERHHSVVLQIWPEQKLQSQKYLGRHGLPWPLIKSAYASESTSKLDSLDSRIRIRVRALNGQIH